MILLTGVSGGIGNYLYSCYYQKKEEVIGTYHLHKPEGREFAETCQLDIVNTDGIREFVKENASRLKNITLINCAGISYNSFAHTANLANWAEVIHVNLNGTFYM